MTKQFRLDEKRAYEREIAERLDRAERALAEYGFSTDSRRFEFLQK